MIGRARSVPAAAVLALCAACSASSPGQVVCAPCPSPVTVAVSGLPWSAGDAGRLRVCVGDLPCTDVSSSERGLSCKGVSCVPVGDALRITLGGKPRTVANLPVRVTASRGKRQDVRQGTATMTFTKGREPCGCDSAHATVALG
ncbi:hypothetical protein [Actinomadura chokoriensis]|uniref:Uncharacterized protein n=1 Tax=Actinomadura chokoriensis TaxID=454156 RepID=A0ABV4R245_9ACTN